MGQISNGNVARAAAGTEILSETNMSEDREREYPQKRRKDSTHLMSLPIGSAYRKERN